ncbi:angiopoietin-1-like isoform X1 [Mytilus californianus]|uniref:angiopoietin-1-like isoform X1 n=1 Tax=Mytilus californianus TaxID=6549 RepID=UPI002246DFC4|nr:angiopoietin-1-like isoform X1 [Mytilus californianus]
MSLYKTKRDDNLLMKRTITCINLNMDNFMVCKYLNYILIFVLLSPMTTGKNDEEVDVPLVDNQNAPLVATLDMSKVNRHVKKYVREAVETKMEDIEGNINEYVSNIEKNVSVGINDTLMSIVEEILKETGYGNENTEKTLQVQEQLINVATRLNILENIIKKCVMKEVKPLECADIDFIKDGVFLIFPKGYNHPKYAYCVLKDNRKWTVIQRRFDFTVNFTRTWNEYKEGFGNVSGEHWLGNEYIHAISTNEQHKVRFVLEKDGTEKYAEYSNFRVEDELNKYMLNISGYSGTAGDSLINVRYHGVANRQFFSTYDRDNDGAKYGNCANDNKGGWWYNQCYRASLNDMIGGKIDWIVNMGYYLEKSLVMITRE